MSEEVNVRLDLPLELAWALAQLVKRIGYADCRRLAVDDEEAWPMIHATEALRRALAEAGVAPR